MRATPDLPLEEWTAPSYRVGADGKVAGAQPGQPNNWGRWGAEDQRGTFNLLSAENVVRAAQLVRSGRRFSLAVAMGSRARHPGGRARPMHLFSMTASDVVLGDRRGTGLQISDDVMVMALQDATQLDGLAHFGSGDVLYNGYWAGLVTARSGARRLGMQHWADGIVGRGVLLDVARHLGQDPVEQEIGAEVLAATADAQEVDVGAGDILLVRTGWLGAWHARRDVATTALSGLALDAIPWLAERDVAMLAADNRAVETLTQSLTGTFPFHVAAIRDLGLLLGELFDLDELADDCAADGRYEFLFVAAPLPVVNAVGSPLNPVAVK